MKLLIRWIISAISLAVAAWLVPGIHINGPGGWVTIFIMAVVLGLVNALIRPILKLLSCGLIVLTLGLFTLVINALTFWLAAALSSSLFGAGFTVDSFWAALLGSIIVSLVSFVLSIFVTDKD